MSAVYQTPPVELRRRLNLAQFAEACLAQEMGLLPDPWRMAGTIAAASANAWGAERRPEDFIPRLPSQRDPHRTHDGRPRLSAEAAEFQLRCLFGGF